MANAVVVVVLHVRISLPLRGLLRLLILGLQVVEKNHLILEHLSLQILDGVVVILRRFLRYLSLLALVN